MEVRFGGFDFLMESVSFPSRMDLGGIGKFLAEVSQTIKSFLLPGKRRHSLNSSLFFQTMSTYAYVGALGVLSEA